MGYWRRRQLQKLETETLKVLAGGARTLLENNTRECILSAGRLQNYLPEVVTLTETIADIGQVLGERRHG